MMKLSEICVRAVTVSDSRSAGEDTSGARLRELLSSTKLLPSALVRDEPEEIRRVVVETSEARVAHALIFTGGTGITSRDRTFETLSALYTKPLPGFMEAFVRLSFEDIGPRAILARPSAGTFREMILFSLPGSENAVRLGVTKLILPMLPHAVGLLRRHEDDLTHTAHGSGA
jgi:molybdopterin adenylyltransferase